MIAFLNKVLIKLKYLSRRVNQNIASFSVLKKKSDVKRWEKNSSLLETWDERTKLLAQQIPKDSVVLEFGAGRLILKKFLPKGCTYLHSDIVYRNEKTIVLDLNSETLPRFPKVDVIVFSGVLEYVIDVERLLNHCKDFTKLIVMSYATTTEYPVIKNRRINGWISDLSHQDFKVFSKKINFELTTTDKWRKQHLYILKFNK